MAKTNPTDESPSTRPARPEPYYELRRLDGTTVREPFAHEQAARDAAQTLLTDGDPVQHIGQDITMRGKPLAKAEPLAIVRCVDVQDGGPVRTLSEQVALMQPGDLASPSTPMRNYALGPERTIVNVPPK